MLEDDYKKVKSVRKLIDKGKISEALFKMDVMLKKNPDDDYLYYYKGLIYQSLGDIVKADELFTKANEILKHKIGGLE
jgi:tetratricopeptide (TPR) repeat protein